MQVPTIDDVNSAAERIRGEAVRTPLLRSDALDQMVGKNVFLKPECLQRTGSFKFRGAYNAISQLSKDECNKGIVASSSGNHAQGVAEAARLFGANATIIMPSDAPKMKVHRTQASGAEIVYYDRASEDRDLAVAEFMNEKGGVFIHPFNNPNVIAGQGTVGLEVAEDLQNMGLELDHMVICTGGGGLTSGVTLAIKHHFPDAKIYSSEPAGFDDYARSLKSGTIETNDSTAGSVCDAVISPSPGPIGFEINRKYLFDGLVVTDEEALDAVRFAFEELKLVVEPGGAVALASVIKYARDWDGTVVALTLSGGNVDPAMFDRAISN